MHIMNENQKIYEDEMYRFKQKINKLVTCINMFTIKKEKANH